MEDNKFPQTLQKEEPLTPIDTRPITTPTPAHIWPKLPRKIAIITLLVILGILLIIGVADWIT